MQTSLPTPIIAVVGSRHSGKTTTVTTIVKALATKGYKIATVKHIHQPTFTIDTKGRDTWKHAQAGAQTIVAVSANELTTINKQNTTKLTLNDITKNTEDNTDIIIIEGFRNLVAQAQTVPKIVTVKNKKEINEALQVFKPILAFTSTLPQPKPNTQNIPLVDIKSEPEKLIRIIDKRIGSLIKKKQQTKTMTSIDINGETLPLNPYVQRVTRNILIGLISTLKGANIKGTENIQIKITKPNKTSRNSTHTNHQKSQKTPEKHKNQQKITENYKKQPN